MPADKSHRPAGPGANKPPGPVGYYGNKKAMIVLRNRNKSVTFAATTPLMATTVPWPIG